MEEREARSSRFVSQLVGPMVKQRQPPSNSKLRLWQLAALRVHHLERLLHKAVVYRDQLRRECSGQLSDLQNQSWQEPTEPPSSPK